MPRPIVLLWLLIPLAAAESWPQAVSGLEADPAITWSIQPGGLRVAVMPNRQPPGRVALRLLVPSGSLDEDDHQRGWAHLLEHMAFQGSRNFPGTSLVERMQAIGLSFGHHTNAHTAYDETVFKLDLPDAQPATLALGMEALADWACGLVIPADRLERETGVVLAEMRDRDKPGRRRWYAIAEAAYAGSAIPLRHPIGVETDLRQVDPDRLRAWYANRYRPERMVLAVVGDVEPSVALAAVGQAFASASAAGAAARERPAQVPAEGLAVAVRRDAEAEDTLVLLCRLRAEAPRDDSAALRREELEQALGEAVLDRRLERLAASATSPILAGGAGSYRWLGIFHAQLQARVRHGRSEEAAALLERERRRLLAFGPTLAELAVAVAAQRSALERAVREAGTRQSPALADGLVQTVKLRRVPLSPAGQRELLLPVLAGATPERVRNACRAAWGSGRTVLLADGRDAPAEATALRTAWEQAGAEDVQPPIETSAATWAYAADAAMPAPAESASATHAIRLLRFPNRVEAAVQASPRQPGQVQVRLRLHIEPGTRPAGVGELLGRAFLDAGLARHDRDQLHELLADRAISLRGAGCDELGFLLAATCAPADLLRCLELLTAFLNDPGWRPDAEERARTAWFEALAGAESDLDQRLDRAWEARIAGRDAERRAATRAEAEATTFASCRAWLDPLLRSAPLSCAVVGDCDAEQAAAALARTVGRLPARVGVTHAATCPPALAEPAPVAPGSQRLEVPGSIARAVLRCGWPVGDQYDIARVRRLGLLADAFNELLRQELRERLGKAYSPAAWVSASQAWRGSGWLACQVSVAADQVEAAQGAVRRVARQLAEQGVPPEVFTRVREPRVKGLAAWRSRNEYWCDQVAVFAASQPFRLDWASGMEADFAAITREELAALALRCLVPERLVEVVGVCPGR